MWRAVFLSSSSSSSNNGMRRRDKEKAKEKEKEKERMLVLSVFVGVEDESCGRQNESLIKYVSATVKQVCCGCSSPLVAVAAICCIRRRRLLLLCLVHEVVNSVVVLQTVHAHRVFLGARWAGGWQLLSPVVCDTIVWVDPL